MCLLKIQFINTEDTVNTKLPNIFCLYSLNKAYGFVMFSVDIKKADWSVMG